MVMTDVRPVIEAPIRVPYQFGLFSVLDFTPDELAGRGFAWESLGCGPLALQYTQDPCIVDVGEDPEPHEKEDLLGCSVSSTSPFTVVAYDDSSLGRPPRSTDSGVARARARLELFEQHTVEVFTAVVLNAAATIIPIPAPAGSDLKTQFAYSIGEIEHRLAGLGGEGVILVRRSSIALHPEYFTRTGSMMRTLLGTPVAAMGGWGLNRDAVLGVAGLLARRGGIATGRGFDTKINSHADYAERDYAIGWECTPVISTPSVAT